MKYSIVFASFLAVLPSLSFAGDWTVTGVAANDVLNVRSGPSTDFPVVDRLRPGVSGLEMRVCVYVKAKPSAPRTAKMPEWCAISQEGGGMIGWVNVRYLSQTTGEQPAAISSTLPLMRAYPGFVGCYLVGESAATGQYLDDAADLVACKGQSAGQKALARTLTKVDDIDGYDLFSVPLR